MRKIGVILVAVILVGILMCGSQVAFAECAHANINHSAVVWYDLGTMHSYHTTCKCMDCGATMRCHPHPGPTPGEPHRWNEAPTEYKPNGDTEHLVITGVRCVCGAKMQSTATAAHQYKYIYDQHSHEVHYVYFKCVCGKIRYDSYRCPSPCPGDLQLMNRISGQFQ